LNQNIQFSGVSLAALNTLFPRWARARTPLWIAVILALASLGSAFSAESNRVTLTNAAQVISLTPEEDKNGTTPVRIRGMVSYYEPGLLFVQDETAGVFVYHTGEHLAVKAGQFIEVTGVAAPGLYSPIIASPKFQSLEDGPTIPPRPVSLAEIKLGGLDAQWVEFTALVRGQRTFPDRLDLEVAVPPDRIKVWVAMFEGSDRTRLVGSYVRIRGVVCGGFLDKGRLTEFKVLASKLSDVAVVKEASENPFEQPLLSIRDLRGSQARKLVLGQVRTRGIVTLYWPGRALFIQDSDAGVEVLATESVDGLEPGSTVEVAGFPGPVLGAPVLEDAVIRKLATEPVPKAARISNEDLCCHNCELVEIEADLLGHGSWSSNLCTLVLQSQNQHFTALLPLPDPTKGPVAIASGSRVRLTGVCVREEAIAKADPTIRLFLRSPSDIAVVTAPPTLPGRGVAIATAIAGVATAGVLLALWHIGRLHARTKHMLRAQTSLQAEMHQNEEQLRRSMEERERIGRDLHDDIIQSIYAVGLNLEDCRRIVRQFPEKSEARLTSAIEMLNSAMRNVRGFLAGLEPKVLNGREFKTALKSLALTSGDGPTQFQLEVDPSAANRLSSPQATQILHIAKEAMSNCLRHARASTLVVSLLPTGTGVRLEVFDNGEGFNPEALDAKGHGLRNMSARAREIGADLKIVSAVGQGCRILVNVPMRNANEHG
jgi:signal transduction histidine kinase